MTALPIPYPSVLKEQSSALNLSGPARTTVVRADPLHFRSKEVEPLLGYATKAKEQLGWTPEVTFAEAVREDLKAAERYGFIKKHRCKTFERHE